MLTRVFHSSCLFLANLPRPTAPSLREFSIFTCLINPVGVEAAWSKTGARGRNRTGTTFLSRQILNLLCLPISPLGLALAGTAALYKSRQNEF